MDLRTKVFVLLERMFCFVFCFCFLVKKKKGLTMKKNGKKRMALQFHFLCAIKLLTTVD